MSSSQMATPAADSSARTSECEVMAVAPLVTGPGGLAAPISLPAFARLNFLLLLAGRARRTRIPCRLRQAGPRCGHYLLRGEPEVPVEVLVVGGGTEVLQAHALARVTGERPPAERDAGLDADPGADPRRQHLVLVGSVLRGEPFHTRHGDHPGADTLGGKLLPGGDGDLHLTAGGDEDHGRVATRRLGEDVPAPDRALRAGETVTGAHLVRAGTAVEHGQVLPAQAEAGGPVGVLEHGPPGHHGLVGVRDRK